MKQTKKQLEAELLYLRKERVWLTKSTNCTGVREINYRIRQILKELNLEVMI